MGIKLIIQKTIKKLIKNLVIYGNINAKDIKCKSK